jgi:hypothetical protein
MVHKTTICAPLLHINNDMASKTKNHPTNPKTRVQDQATHDARFLITYFSNKEKKRISRVAIGEYSTKRNKVGKEYVCYFDEMRDGYRTASAPYHIEVIE